MGGHGGGRRARGELCSVKESEGRGSGEVGVVGECSTSKQLNQDGVMEENDNGVRSFGAGGHGAMDLEPGVVAIPRRNLRAGELLSSGGIVVEDSRKGRDGNSARGRGYPRIPDPTGMGTGSKIRPRARVRASKSARGRLTGWNLYPRAYPPPASK
jgi:hypothetical protein